MMAGDTFGTYSPGGWRKLCITLTRRFSKTKAQRFLTSLLRKLATAGLRTPVDIDVLGVPMRLHIGDNVCERKLLFYPDAFDVKEREALSRIFHKGFIFIDIGANVGLYSLFVASRCGASAKILALEPQPEIFSRLQFNISGSSVEQPATEYRHSRESGNPVFVQPSKEKLDSRFRGNDGNGVGCFRSLNSINITALPIAIADKAGTMPLYINRENRGQSSLKIQTAEKIDVPVMRLIDLMDKHGIHKADAIKIDVEGEEDVILRDFLTNTPPERLPRMLLIEKGAERWSEDCRALCLAHGYRDSGGSKMNMVLER